MCVPLIVPLIVKQRFKKRIGKVSPSEMLGIERAIKIQLGIH